MQVSTVYIVQTAALLVSYTNPDFLIAGKNCSCGHYEQYDSIGPYCSNWYHDGPKFCFLSGGANASTCPHAVQWGDENLYYTENEEICKMSQDYTLEHCNCGHYPEYDLVGPYCAEWIEDESPFCLLSGGYGSRYCPGAVQVENENLYWTRNVEVCNRSQNYTLEYCNCGYYPEYDQVGPYCAPFCFLSGGYNARQCPGAIQQGNESLYWTEDAEVCQRSKSFILKNCKCGHYNRIGPFCANWIANEPPFCFLSGGSDSKFCPGAVQLETENIYMTEDGEICNITIPPDPTRFNLLSPKPLTIKEIAHICLLSLSAIIGTCGNALVIKYFAQSEGSSRPGSRLVIALALIDFVSSLWLPGYDIIVLILYNFDGMQVWPLGEPMCYISNFYPILNYQTPWFLLAISIERARAIFRPFAGKLRLKFVLLISIVILVSSCALHLKYALSQRYFNNINVYIEGVLYEYPTCEPYMSSEEHFTDALVTYSIGIWSPMLLIAVIYILMYLKLKKQAEIRQHCSSQDSNNQMTQISQTFTIVLVVFYICYLPSTIIYTYLTYLDSINQDHDSVTTNTVLGIANILMYTNSSMNPVIYSKIHVRIYKVVKQFMVAFRDRCTCRVKITSCCKCLDAPTSSIPTVSSTVEPANLRMNKLNQYSHHTASYSGTEVEFPLPDLSEQDCEILQFHIHRDTAKIKQFTSYENNVEETAF